MLRTSVHRSVSAAAARAQICRRLSASTAIHLESATEPVLHAERCLRRALAERTPARCGSPLNLSGSDDLVKIALATPAELDAAALVGRVLEHKSGPAPWRVLRKVMGSGALGAATQTATITLSDGELQAELEVPHTLKAPSTPAEVINARPRLEAGELRFETNARELSMAQARAIVHAALGANAAVAPADGGPLAALERVLRPVVLASPEHTRTATSDANGGGGWVSPTAARASEANAAAWAKSGSGGPRLGSALSAPNLQPPGEASTHLVKPKSEKEALEILAKLGARVEPAPAAGSEPRWKWEALAGADEARTAVEEALLMPLRHPEAFAMVAAATGTGLRSHARTAALLFYGPPGTGKTTAARIAAAEAGLPMVYAPLEALFSKWLGQGEQQLAAIFEAAEALGGEGRPALLFLDELDALAGNRQREMHEASRRMLSVLLRRMDGLEASASIALVGATNRRQDLDAALLSRFECRVHFAAPDAPSRAEIFGLYAQHLSDADRAALGEAADGLSGRDIYDLCRAAERKHVVASLQFFGDAGFAEGVVVPPPKAEYEEAVRKRLESSAVETAEEEKEREAAKGKPSGQSLAQV